MMRFCCDFMVERAKSVLQISPGFHIKSSEFTATAIRENFVASAGQSIMIIGA